MNDPGVLSPCLDCGGDDIDVSAASPGLAPAYVRCRDCGTAVMGDTTERALWIWSLPRQGDASGAGQEPWAGLPPQGLQRSFGTS